jgi:hypothetical protein
MGLQQVYLDLVSGRVLTSKYSPAIDFTNWFCCDRHDDGFELVKFFPGRFLASEALVFVDQTVNATTLRPKYRPVKEREPLKATLYAWRSHAHRNDPLRGVRQISWILTDADIEVLCKTPRMSLANVDQLKTLLGASSDWIYEWGQKVVNEVCSFDAKKM